MQSCTTMWMYLMALNWPIKMTKMVNFICIIYHNFKIMSQNNKISSPDLLLLHSGSRIRVSLLLDTPSPHPNRYKFHTHSNIFSINSFLMTAVGNTHSFLCCELSIPPLLTQQFLLTLGSCMSIA